MDGVKYMPVLQKLDQQLGLHAIKLGNNFVIFWLVVDRSIFALLFFDAQNMSVSSNRLQMRHLFIDRREQSSCQNSQRWRSFLFWAMSVMNRILFTCKVWIKTKQNCVYIVTLQNIKICWRVSLGANLLIHSGTLRMVTYMNTILLSN